MTTNRMFLQDGTNFITDPSKESDPVKARQEKIHFLLGVNLIDVARNPLWKIDQIRALATGLVKTTDGKKRLHKDVLIENLKEFQDSERKTKIGVLEAMIEDGQVDAKLIDFVFVAMSKNLSPNEISSLILGELSKTYKTDKSLVKTGIRNLLKAIQKDERFISYQAAIAHVKSLIYQDDEIKSKMHGINRDQAQKVLKSHEQRQDIREEPILKYIKTSLSGDSWQDIAYAIGFATGRRMAEILGNHSTWEDGGDNTIIFTGLLKGKGRYVDPNQCPDALVPLAPELGGIPLIDAPVRIYPIGSAEQVLSGIAKLEVAGKKDTPHERINAVHSKALASRPSGTMILLRSESLLDQWKSEPDASGKVEELGKQFKASRDFFAAYKAKHEYSSESHAETEEHFVMKQLHHNDLKTTLTYRKLRLV